MKLLVLRIAELESVEANRVKLGAPRNEGTLARYTAMAAECEPPPIMVTWNGQGFEILDGMHRLITLKRSGAQTIKALLQE